VGAMDRALLKRHGGHISGENLGSPYLYKEGWGGQLSTQQSEPIE